MLNPVIFQISGLNFFQTKTSFFSLKDCKANGHQKELEELCNKLTVSAKHTCSAVRFFPNVSTLQKAHEWPSLELVGVWYRAATSSIAHSLVNGGFTDSLTYCKILGGPILGKNDSLSNTSAPSSSSELLELYSRVGGLNNSSSDSKKPGSQYQKFGVFHSKVMTLE